VQKVVSIFNFKKEGNAELSNVRCGSIVLKNSNSEQSRFSAEFRLPGKSDAIDARDCTKGSVTNLQPGLIPPRIQETLSGLRANAFSLISETEFFNTIGRLLLLTALSFMLKL
jgi:hypothetical protein